MDSTHKCHDYISPVTAITIQLGPSIDPWCITYGTCTLWCDKTLLSIQHSQCCPNKLTMDSTRKHHDYISPATAICISNRHSIHLNVLHMVTWALYYVINHYVNTAFTCCATIDHGSTRKHNGLHFTRNCHNYSIDFIWPMMYHICYPGHFMM